MSPRNRTQSLVGGFGHSVGASCSPVTFKEMNEQQESSSFSYQNEVLPFSTSDDEDEEELHGLFGGQGQICGDYLVCSESPDYGSFAEKWALQENLKEQSTSNIKIDHDVKGSTVNSFGIFINIRDAHSSTDIQHKNRLLHSFKKAVSIQAPEFMDNRQKKLLCDSLCSGRSRVPHVNSGANKKPVPLAARQCCQKEPTIQLPCGRSSGVQNGEHQNMQGCTRQEEFTNLSLDLVPGGSLEEMLENYLMETPLEYRCECGVNKSTQTMVFETLPRVLILHIKRFRFTASYNVVKIRDPVVLFRELVVSSKQGGGCFSLVSAISHFGNTTNTGHYICDSVHPDESPDETTDCWLTFNDSAVTETTGESVCRQRQDSAYILFYKQQIISGFGWYILSAEFHERYMQWLLFNLVQTLIENISTAVCTRHNMGNFKSNKKLY
ncbi:hypothetical protein PAMP_007364 [Pampus punctatissimus]